MALKDMRKRLHEAAESLSSISDTLYDEATAPHWKPKLAQLDADDAGDVSRFIEEAQEVLEDPEADAEEKIEGIERDDNSDKAPKPSGAEADSSSLPASSDFQGEPEPQGSHAKTASVKALWSPEGLSLDYSSLYVANSSVSPDSLGGPRVDDIAPGGGGGLYGNFGDNAKIEDQWSADGGGISRREENGEDYDYTSPWENDVSSKNSGSSVPDSNTDDTPTEAYDFGLGFGAKGQGVQYPNASGEGSGGVGVWGPHSGLPGSPSTSSGDSTRLEIDDKLNPRQAAYSALYGVAALPQDTVSPSARADYYPGAKEGTSSLPSSPEANQGLGGKMLDTYYVEQDVNNNFVERGDTTRTEIRPHDHQGQDGQEPWASGGEATR